jgi:hypothetical protein
MGISNFNNFNSNSIHKNIKNIPHFDNFVAYFITLSMNLFVDKRLIDLNIKKLRNKIILKLMRKHNEGILIKTE